MVLKATTAVTTTINQPVEVSMDAGKITKLVITTPPNDVRITGAQIDWIMGTILPDGKFETFSNESIEVDEAELLAAMSKPAEVGESVGGAVERVIWEHLINIGRVPVGTQEI